MTTLLKTIPLGDPRRISAALPLGRQDTGNQQLEEGEPMGVATEVMEVTGKRSGPGPGITAQQYGHGGHPRGSRRSRTSRLRQQAGLTAVELLVDVAVLASIGLIAVAMTSQYVESGRARTAAEQLAGTFQQARQYAIANAATYTVALTGTTVAVTCTAGCPPNSPSEPATPILNGAATNVLMPPITFDSLGSATAGTVTVSYPGAVQWQVRVTEAGRVRTCTPACS